MGRGWRLGTGYHRVIEASALVLDGRKIQWQGAHARGHNKDSIGIVVTGNNLVPGQEWDREQEEALADWLRFMHIFWPAAKAFGHRALPGAVTECPGLDVRDWAESMGLEHLVIGQ
jgi:hypothetical protein